MEFRILGPIAVLGRTARARLGGAKQTALLATLIVRANHLTSVEQLIDSVWAESPPAGAITTVHTYVFRLRRAFDEVAEDGGSRIVTRPAGYLLRVEPEELDLDVFRKHVQYGRRAADAGEFEAAASELRAGLALWRGPALADVPSELLQRNEVLKLTEERLGALERRIGIDLELGRHTDLVGELRGLTAEYPLREQFWGQLMLALYRSGRQAESLNVYQEVRKLHAEEIGIDPGPELQSLHNAILSNEPSLDRPAPVVTVHTAPKMPQPVQLPTDIVGLVGRATVANHVSELLTAGAQRNATPIVVLSGLPGIGKTALATHIAHRLRPRFPDGQLYVNLRGYAQAQPVTPADVLARFLRALGLAPDLVPLDVDEQSVLYRSMLADKKVLVVLDDANAAEQVRPLLPAEPGCAVLVTSRDSLSGLTAIEGATRFTLDALSTTDSISLLGSVIGDIRVVAEPAAADELARLCGHLPLALRIAAANLSTRNEVSLSEYVAELQQGNRLAALAVEGDDQTAVRAAFDLSYSQLPQEAAFLFRQLGLVPGPDFNAYSAAALVDTGLANADQLLGQLLAASLVQDIGPERYQLHDLMRYYAVQRGAAEDSPAVRDSALERLRSLYFQATSAASNIIEPVRDPPAGPARLPEVVLPEFADRAAASAWVELEDRNLHALVNHAAENGPNPYAWHIADAMTSPLALAPRFGEWVTVSQTGLRAAEQAGDREGEGIMLISLGHAYNTTGRVDLAIEILSRALTLYQELDQPRRQLVCYHTLGMSFLWMGRLTPAVEDLTASLELSTRLNYAYYRNSSVHGLGVAHRYLGQLDTALEQLTQSLKFGAENGDPYGQANWMFSLGLTYWDLGRFDEAVEQLTETLNTYEQINNDFGISRCLVGLASAYAQQERTETALTTARRGLLLARQVKHRRTEVDALNVLGGLYVELDDLTQAKENFRAALVAAESMGPYLFGRIEAKIGLAAVAGRVSDWDTARQHAGSAMAAVRASGFRLHEAAALLALAQIDQATGDIDAAAKRCDAALAVCRETGQRAWAKRARKMLDGIGRLDDTTDRGGYRS
ncbi:MAG TPA: BTAD domain-containing putative transcriptional regulator [Pseudonocardiaceae bacterium]